MIVINFTYIKEVAQKVGFDVLENEPLKNYTSFKIGGTADLFIIATEEDGLKKLISACKESQIPVFILGKGSNLLVSDDGIEGVVIKLAGVFNKITLVDDDEIFCGAGISLAKLCNFAYENGLSGLEFAWGIPGSSGGAVYMNAGAYGGEMKDVLTACYHLDCDCKSGTFSKNELDLSYRHSVYANNKGYIITGLLLKLKKDSPVEIRKRMDDYMQRRKDKQPLDYPSAGSVFKRPDGYFAGALIERANLKGKQIGGAQVSEKHAGFIINKDNATCKDVEELIRFIKEKVKKETGVNLECEVKPIGRR